MAARFLSVTGSADRLRQAHQALSVNGEDSIVPRKANAGGHFHPLVRGLVKAFLFDFLGFLKLLFLGGFGLFLRALGGVKIHQDVGISSHSAALDAEIAHAVAVNFVAGDDLVTAVFHAELLIGPGDAWRRQQTQRQRCGKQQAT